MAGLTAFVGSCLLLASCGKEFTPNARKLAERTDQAVGCQTNFEDEFWDGIYDFALANETLPNRATIRAAFENTFASGRLRSLNAGDRTRLLDALIDLYDAVTEDTMRALSVEQTNHTEILQVLTALELGDRTTPQKSALQDKIRAKFADIERITGQADNLPDCPSRQPAPAPVAPPQPTPPPVTPAPPRDTPPAPPSPTPTAGQPTLLEEWQRTLHPAVFGGLKALSTAYQSCRAGVAPALSSATANVQGIIITGKHDNGVGSKREIADLAALIRTHPYLSQYRRPSSVCYDVLKKPMIYDYGGKPYAETGDNAILDFFRNAGSGTSVLGVDCSGFVYSALATAGLKLKKDGRLKAITVHGVNARQFMDPKTNNLTCLTHAQFSGNRNLQPGDVLASTGHVVIVESTGADPFGIRHLTKEAECKAANIDTARFDFTILQSSPSKGGIGINHIRAADYLADGGTMATALTQHAVTACRARIKNIAITTSSTAASLVRHLRTADCLDRPIRIAREECIAGCASNPTQLP